MTKLLIVDDNEQNLYMLQVLLKGSGYEVTLARDGAEALEEACATPPDMIITDILMPVMDGFTLCRKWKKDEVLKTIPFVFYTATYADPKDEELALSLGAERFIRKPMEPAAFVEILREVIREAEAGRLVAPRKPVEEERIFLKEYNEALIRKLEDKMLQLEQANRRLSVLYRVSTSLALVKRLEELAPHVLRTVTEGIGYTRANYFTFDEERQELRLLEAVGFSDEVLARFRQDLVFRLGEERGLVGLVGQTQEPLIVVDTMSDPRWITLDKTIRSALLAPVVYEGRLLGVANFLSTKVGAFNDEDAKDVMILANHMAVTIENARLFEQAQQEIAERVQAEKDLKRSLEKLQKALEGTIHALAATTEMRDPYTAGHQRRVAELAGAIAEEMGLPKDKIEGIRMAGLIHDVGKISVPAEILSKPSKLNEMEMDLIKAHSQIGYDILKEIDFPWAVAKIVLQHHERMDGSGYPQGLKGDEILLEARILAVADVVEAMASHRPYRPALGIDAALSEIEKNRGRLYDPEIVAACLRLFREKGFTLEV
jgi:putative nucleotidyltransferase with HDIG domain